MKIKDQVCSLEPGNVLKKLGVEQDSLYSYFQYDKWNILLRETREIFSPNNECGYNKENLICSAFTDAELEREIFQWIENQEVPYDFIIRFSSTGGVWGDETFSEMHEVQLIDWSDVEESIMERAGTGANAKAKMLIHLLKNNLIEK